MTAEIVVAVVDPKQYELDADRAVAISDAFAPMSIQRESVLDEYTEIANAPMSAELCTKAGVLRKKLVKIRTGTEKIHKSQKRLFLRAGQFVDALKNAGIEPVVQMEDDLRCIENHYEDIDKARIARLKTERDAILEGLEVENIPSCLGNMPEDAWEAMRGGYQQAYEKRIEEARLAEENRIEAEQATAKENARLAAENAKLQAEKAEADEALRITRKEASAKLAESIRIEQEKKAAEAEAEKKRIAEQKKADSTANKKKKNCAARDCLQELGLDKETAELVVGAIAIGEVASVSMNY